MSGTEHPGTPDLPDDEDASAPVPPSTGWGGIEAWQRAGAAVAQHLATQDPASDRPD